jgi:pimeloyl-ACP methyl ester carboxylesterase
MPIYENGPVRIHYEETGSGCPLLVIPGGGLNATIARLDGPGSFNPLVEFADTHRCIAGDLRNAPAGGSSGPLEVDRPWDAFTDDHLGLMDHLGIDRFVVMGFCIGGPMIWNLLRRAADRVIAAVLVHPSGHRPELPDQFYQNNIAGWAPEIRARRPDITMAMAEAFLDRMYRANADFVFTVSRDFARGCQTPMLIMPDDIPPHPYATAMESALLAPNAQVSLYPWREPAEHIPLALRHVRTFLAAHLPAA